MFLLSFTHLLTLAPILKFVLSAKCPIFRKKIKLQSTHLGMEGVHLDRGSTSREGTGYNNGQKGKENEFLIHGAGVVAVVGPCSPVDDVRFVGTA